jgi:hypothetical protein
MTRTANPSGASLDRALPSSFFRLPSQDKRGDEADAEEADDLNEHTHFTTRKAFVRATSGRSLAR